MVVHLPTLKQLQYLVALRRHGHFGKAADACFVTQSTLSAGLRELEALLGVVLVERTRRLVRFTALGEKIADKAIRVLREAEELAEMARAQALSKGRDQQRCVRSAPSGPARLRPSRASLQLRRGRFRLVVQRSTL